MVAQGVPCASALVEVAAMHLGSKHMQTEVHEEATQVVHESLYVQKKVSLNSMLD